MFEFISQLFFIAIGSSYCCLDREKEKNIRKCEYYEVIYCDDDSDCDLVANNGIDFIKGNSNAPY